MNGKDYRQDAERFLRRLRELKPDVPIIFGSFHYPLVHNPAKHAFAAELKEKFRREDPRLWAKFDIVPLWDLCSKDCDGTGTADIRTITARIAWAGRSRMPCGIICSGRNRGMEERKKRDA
jgi:hypothetical protein